MCRQLIVLGLPVNITDTDSLISTSLHSLQRLAGRYYGTKTRNNLEDKNPWSVVLLLCSLFTCLLNVSLKTRALKTRASIGSSCNGVGTVLVYQSHGNQNSFLELLLPSAIAKSANRTQGVRFKLILMYHIFVCFNQRVYAVLILLI